MNLRMSQKGTCFFFFFFFFSARRSDSCFFLSSSSSTSSSLPPQLQIPQFPTFSLSLTMLASTHPATQMAYTT